MAPQESLIEIYSKIPPFANEILTLINVKMEIQLYNSVDSKPFYGNQLKIQGDVYGDSIVWQV